MWFIFQSDVEHVFNAQETSWGFRSFIALSDLSPKTGFMINGTIILELEVSLGDVINYSTDRGKTETVSKSEMELQAKDAKIKELEKAMMTIETAKAMVNEELKACKQELAIKDTARELEPQISNSEIEELKNEIKSLQDANQKVEEELEMGDMGKETQNSASQTITVLLNFVSPFLDLSYHFWCCSSGDYGRQLMIYPKGKNVKYLSVYLNVPDAASLPNGWSRYADFCFYARHVFNAEAIGWGFPSFIPLSDLSQKKGYMIKGTIILEVEVSVRDVINYSAKIISKSEMKLQDKDAKLEELKKAMTTVVMAKAMVDEELNACKQELAIRDTALHYHELELQTSNSKNEELKNEIKSLQDKKYKVEEELKRCQRELEMGDVIARLKDLEHELAIAKKAGEIKELFTSLKYSEKRVQDVKEAAADWRSLTFSTCGLEGAQM
ncbi:MATH domain and coiled-coil domain-containing protein At2g05420 [Amborella trichopoda]|nr:MATH domain and coiled-coil domain-containing protein At2g05420 [Amborella trichopoda]|eukprot:XP_020530754.1 MATH domain and coiled-coil domain-containing protein At2g05420 [Amborella trichopoda]